jgi:enoyl-CoA hydratase
MSLVLRSESNGVTTITLNRPEKLNALYPDVFGELRVHLASIAVDTSVGCVVITGAGRSFCAGHDLGAIADGNRGDNKYFESETVDMLEQLPQPTIAKVRGHCLTGGLELALACDIIIAGDTAQFADTHGQWGLAPVWGMSVRLPERIGRAHAAEMSYSSNRVDGVRAAQIGLANHCYADDALDAEVDTLAARICANSASGNRLYKRLWTNSDTMPREAAMLLERTRLLGYPTDTAERMSRPRK